MASDIPGRKLDSFFRPRAIALVGASVRSYLPRKLWKSVRASGFSGGFYPVNSGRDEAFGVKYAGLMRLGSKKGQQAVEKLANIMLRFDALCRGLGADLLEFDLNSIGFYAESAAFRALDAKIVLAETRGDFS